MNNSKLIKADQSDNSSTNNSEQSLVEGQDYYLENGFYVFTASFLRRRGHCCDNGCRHCPYQKESNE